MENFLTYKGKPVVRQGDTIYYGNTDEKFIIMMFRQTRRRSS